MHAHTPPLGTVSLISGMCVGMFAAKGEHSKHTQLCRGTGLHLLNQSHSLLLPWKGFSHINCFCRLSIYTYVPYQKVHWLVVLKKKSFICIRGVIVSTRLDSWTDSGSDGRSVCTSLGPSAHRWCEWWG